MDNENKTAVKPEDRERIGNLVLDIIEQNQQYSLATLLSGIMTAFIKLSLAFDAPPDIFDALLKESSEQYKLLCEIKDGRPPSP